MAAGLAITMGSFIGVSDKFYEYLGSGTGAAGDLVNIELGELLAASGGDEVMGVSQEAFTSASTGVSINVTPGLIVAMDNDNIGGTFAASHVGGGFDITGATGAQLVDTSSILQTAGSVAGQLRCLEYNPQGISNALNSDVSVGLFMIAERQFPI